MSKILELREKRAKAWEAAKKFLDSKRGEDGLLSAEDTAAYEKMEKEVVDLGKEIERLERQAAIDAELNKPTSEPITNKPNNHPDGEEKTGRARYTRWRRKSSTPFSMTRRGRSGKQRQSSASARQGWGRRKCCGINPS